ncbi:hypothetical protein B0J14DRAFT_570051 [Halenospora varia]|nr:hypothetical protein B0J14DRAFT_570051 [Halenospora varia]
MVDLRKVTLPLRGGKAPPSSTYKQLALPAKSIVITEKPFVDKDGVEWWPEMPSNTHKHAAASIAPPPPKTKPATHAPASTPHKPAGNPSQKTTADKTAVGDTRECLICVEDVERRNVLKTSCDHYWCRKCLTDRFQSATKNETQYPPKCCDEISLTKARSFLDPKVASDFQKKRVEFETTAKDRVYCYKNDCGKFIHAEHIRHNIATCSSCSRQTCTKCKTKQHSGKCEDVTLEMAKQGLKAIGGKMCPKCGQALERFDGCNHFTCVCGQEFCFLCLRKWKDWNCSCPQYSNIEAEKENAPYKTLAPGAPAERPNQNRPDPGYPRHHRREAYGRDRPGIYGPIPNMQERLRRIRARIESLERLKRGHDLFAPEAERNEFHPVLGIPHSGILPPRPNRNQNMIAQRPFVVNNYPRRRIPETCNHQMERAEFPLFCYFCNRDAAYRCLICRSWFCLECPESVGISSRGII